MKEKEMVENKIARVHEFEDEDPVFYTTSTKSQHKIRGAGMGVAFVTREVVSEAKREEDINLQVWSMKFICFDIYSPRVS